MGTRRFSVMHRRLHAALHEAKKQMAWIRLPRYVIFDSSIGKVRPEYQEAERQAAALGIYLKEYVDWNPDEEEGVDP